MGSFETQKFDALRDSELFVQFEKREKQPL